MLELDGSDGGGQVLRSALTLAALTGEGFRLQNARGSRPTPGLKAQHCAAVRTAAAVCDADVEGAEPGSKTVTFEPNAVDPGDYAVDIGTAGSVTLCFDVLLPLAVAVDAPVTLTATGGTAVKWAPTLAYYRRVKLPLLSDFGLDAAIDPERPGFYPAGDGRATLRVESSDLSTLTLRDRGALEAVRVVSKASESLAEASVAERQADAVVEALGEDYPVAEPTVETAETTSPGSSLLVAADYERSRAGFCALGEKDVAAGEVARRAVDEFRAFQAGPGAVDPPMGDQLMLFLALAGGEVRVPAVTQHVRTNREVIRAFGLDLDVEEKETGALLTAPGSDHGA